MSSYYDAFGGTSTDGPEDPYADERELERRPIPTNRLVSTFIRPGLAEFDRRNDAYNREMEARELERRDAEMADDEPDYTDYPPEYDEWPELNDHADSLNIITGEVEE